MGRAVRLLGAAVMALCTEALAQTPPEAHRGDVGTPRGNIVGTFNGDPAQPPAAPEANPGRPSPPPKPPPGTRPPPVIVVTPPAYLRRQPLRSLPWDEHRQAIERALAAPDGQMISWVNGTGAGEVTPVGVRFLDGMNCRDLQQRVSSVTSSAETVSTYCMSPDGEWLLVLGPT